MLVVPSPSLCVHDLMRAFSSLSINILAPDAQQRFGQLILLSSNCPGVPVYEPAPGSCSTGHAYIVQGSMKASALQPNLQYECQAACACTANHCLPVQRRVQALLIDPIHIVT